MNNKSNNELAVDVILKLIENKPDIFDTYDEKSMGNKFNSELFHSISNSVFKTINNFWNDNE